MGARPVADGLVLIFVAGTWYLLATLITGKKLFMENVARAALFVELVVSWTVWSHHLLSDQAQPGMLKVVSGEMVTAFELITQGLAFFITLATLWTARPLKMTNELRFLLGGLPGFALAVPAGIMQADVGLNRILHNTQWVVGPHVHVAILVGLTMTLYSAIYLLFPILTNGAKLWSQRLATFHFWAHLLGGIGMGAFMGMAGLKGMLRRTIYYEGEFRLYMILAGLAGRCCWPCSGILLQHRDDSGPEGSARDLPFRPTAIRRNSSDRRLTRPTAQFNVRWCPESADSGHRQGPNQTGGPFVANRLQVPPDAPGFSRSRRRTRRRDTALPQGRSGGARRRRTRLPRARSD